MITKITNFFIAIASIICFTVQINSVSAQTWPPSGMNGSGNQGDPWQITTITQLMNLATYVNAGNGSQTAGKYYKLMNDIEYNYAVGNAYGWSPIGNNPTNNAIFQGNFDGNGKEIINLMINRATTSYIGLFGYVSSAHIHDLGINVYQLIKGFEYVGGLIGRADNAIIENCYVTGTGSVTGTFAVGGLIGYNSSSTIRNSYAICEIIIPVTFYSVNYSNVGGFVGINEGTITTSYAAGNVTILGNRAGGFVGINNNTIMDCYATGNISGSSYLGGFAGINEGNSLTYCYATGDITATGDYVGGLVGENGKEAALINCVAGNNTITGGISNVNRITGNNTDGILSNNYAYGGMTITPSGGEAGTSANMATLMSFNFYNTGTNWGNNIAWSIDTNDNPLESWKICDGETLPFLQWEDIDCTPLPPDTCYFNAYGGDGTQGNPYQIYFPCQLADLATFVNSGNGTQTLNKYFKLMNDIDLIDYSYGEGWEPIGYINAPNGNYWFQGNFEGNEKVITNLMINRNLGVLIGLFGAIFNATIKNIGIEDCQIDGNACVSGLIGYIAGNSTITNCYATGNIKGRAHAVGGLIGGIGNSMVSYANSIENCYATCNLIQTNFFQGGIGGLVGEMQENSTISNSYATGTVIGYMGVGGLVGRLSFGNNTAIFYSHAEGEVEGSVGGVGGLVGENLGQNNITIRNCVAVNPSVNGSAYVNRIVGSDSGGGLSNNYAYEGMTVNGSTVTGGTHNNVNGENKAMDTLMSYNFYHTSSNWYNSIPWSIDVVQDTTKIWQICDGETLPFLQWEGINCGKSIAHPVNDEKEYSLEQHGRSEFSIYPNPTSSHITIYSEKRFHTIEIIDFLGRVRFSQPNTGNNIVDVSGYSTGVYFVRIITETGVEVQKFVKH